MPKIDPRTELGSRSGAREGSDFWMAVKPTYSFFSMFLRRRLIRPVNWARQAVTSGADVLD